MTVAGWLDGVANELFSTKLVTVAEQLDKGANARVVVNKSSDCSLTLRFKF